MRPITSALLVALCTPNAIRAEPTGGKVSIVAVRPYVGGLIYLHVSSGSLCATSVFTFSASEANGKEMYAVALTALASGKKVQLEVSNAAGCTGWSTRLQSIYLYN